MASQPIRGGAGHNGGNGGCGGGGGGGGSSGGGAFALVVADTSVGSAGLVLVGGVGGPGGGGGSSADGTLGVHDDNWGSGGEATNSKICGPALVPVRRAGTGGQGGYGGKGGGGGGGAGGNGGPAIQLVLLADGALAMDANAPLRYAGGRAGTGGTGGTGVQDKNAGPPGNGGSSAERLSIPLVYVAATASNSVSGAPSTYAVDGNPETAWNSGGWAPAWIELDLKHTVTLTNVHLLVGQSPAGPTTHQVYFGSSPAPTALIATLSGSTKDMQWLDIDVPGQPTGRYLRVLTTASPSWVAWREIIVQAQ
jgi:F5/8 type C domain